MYTLYFLKNLIIFVESQCSYSKTAKISNFAHTLPLFYAFKMLFSMSTFISINSMIRNVASSWDTSPGGRKSEPNCSYRVCSYKRKKVYNAVMTCVDQIIALLIQVTSLQFSYINFHLTSLNVWGSLSISIRIRIDCKTSNNFHNFNLHKLDSSSTPRKKGIKHGLRLKNLFDWALKFWPDEWYFEK